MILPYIGNTIVSRKAGNNMTNIERVAEHIARCQRREEVKAALSLLLKPCVEQADPVDQELGVSVADVLAGADITALDK